MANTDNESGHESPSFNEGLRLLKQQSYDGSCIYNTLTMTATKGSGEPRIAAVRRDLLEKHWNSVQQRHMILLQYEEDWSDDSYFKENQYQEVQETYLQARVALSDTIEKLVNLTSSSPSFNTL